MKLHEALAATFSVVGQEMTDAGLAIIARDLKGYPLPAVFAALSRCRKELRRISLIDILDRIPGGHPGAEEAWSIVARTLNDEGVTVVWTNEMAQAFGRARDLCEDPVAARVAFKEVYARLVAESRDQGNPITWLPSLGHDAHGREAPLLEAAEKGRLTAKHVAGLLPYREEPHPRIVALLEQAKSDRSERALANGERVLVLDAPA